jgi:two-component system NtrC family sensor kinase
MVAPLATPVSPKKEVSRFLFAAREQGETAFRESDLEMFVILARQAAVALENAYLHAELRAYIRRVEDSQRALIQAEKLATAGRLTASIAHEINNPLQAVQNCLHLAGRKELPVKERQGYLKMAQGELERLMNTVQRMLDFYRPGALDRKQANINDLLKRVLSLLEQQLTERGIQLHTHYSTRLPNVLVVGDQIQQVFLNLILNAMEAMPKGGELFIETSREINEVVVVLRDTGPGIPEKECEHLFEPFVSTKEGGTGLGLAVSYGIIAAHGGSLDLLTGLGRGACFKVTMPVEES